MDTSVVQLIGIAFLMLWVPIAYLVAWKKATLHWTMRWLSYAGALAMGLLFAVVLVGYQLIGVSLYLPVALLILGAHYTGLHVVTYRAKEKAGMITAKTV